MEGSIRTQIAPNLIGQPSVAFNKGTFDAALWNKGYNILYEEARVCPCRSKGSGSPLPTCQNCRGFGWIFINPLKTKAIVTGINKKAKYVEWSEDSTGTISVTLLNTNKLAEYDRITLIDVTVKRSEIIEVRKTDEGSFVFLTYEPVEILDVFYFESSTLPLVKLAEGEYNIDPTNPYVVELSFIPPATFNGSITVAYFCKSQYHIIDLPHDLRASSMVNSLGAVERIDLPVNAIVRKTHLVLTMDDYGTGIKVINNSYL